MKSNILKAAVGFVFFFACNSLQSQENLNLPWDIWMNPKSNNFEKIQERAEVYFEGRYTGKGSGYKHWKRWEENNRFRLDDSGRLTNFSSLNHREIERIRKGQSSIKRNTVNEWTEWGMNLEGTGKSLGTGVINCIAFHPTNEDIFFVGGPATGLWKTIDHGITWTNITDGWIDVGIAAIAVNYNNPNIIHIITGDADGSDSPSIGIYRTTNGGSTWSPTSLTWNKADGKRGYKIAMNPVNPDIMIAATKDGLYRTVNGFQWDLVRSGHFYDVVYKTGTQFTIYASTSDDIYRSQNSGSSFEFVHTISDSKRIQLAISLSAVDKVYALGGGYKRWGNAQTGYDGFPGFYVSSNSGDSWNVIATGPNVCGYSQGSPSDNQATYDLDLAVNPFDEDEMYIGAIDIYKSTNEGVSWNRQTKWNSFNAQYVHSDIHGLEYNVLNGELYAVTDGGVYVSDDNGATFDDLSSDLNINQFFDVCGTVLHDNYMLGGLYHNGTRTFTGQSTSHTVGGGDGTGCMISHEDTTTIYFSYQLGELFRRKGGVRKKIKPSDSSGPFVSNFAMDPNNSQRIYTGWKVDTVFYSDSEGDSWSWTKLPHFTFYGEEDVRSISPADNSSTVYALTNQIAYRSTNSAISFDAIFLGANLTSIKAFPGLPDQAIFVEGGYTAGNKVYHANGSNITNISTNLPNVPVRCVEILPMITSARIYVGTDIGVFTKLLSETNWTILDTGIPAVSIRDLVLYPEARILRAATFGRGIYETDVPCESIATLTVANDPSNSIPLNQSVQVNDIIVSSRKILGMNGGVTYKAGSIVYLTEGFEAKAGNKVLVGIAGCGDALE